MNLITNFKTSARELKSLRSVIITAMFLAIHTVLSVFISIQVTSTLRISISFIANVAVGCFFGPVVGLIAGTLGDLIQFMIKPTGDYFFGWTLNAALAGLVYGMAFYRKLPDTGRKCTITADTASDGIANSRIADTTDAAQTKQPSMLLRTLPFGCSIFILICWFTAPFLTVTEKAEEGAVPAIIAEGTAFQTFISYLKGTSGSQTAMILAALILVLCILTGLLNLRKSKMLPMLLSTLISCILPLSLYTDNKTTTAGWGYYVTIVLFLIITVCHLITMTRQHAIDVRYLARTFLAVTVVCLLINAGLGTYWCMIMYGKHFMVYFVPRFIKNLIQIPINTVLIYYLMKAFADIPEFRKMIFTKHAEK